MTSYENARVVPVGSVASYRFGTAVMNMIEGVRAWRDARRTAAVLATLSPNQLEDIGLSTADVESLDAKSRLF